MGKKSKNVSKQSAKKKETKPKHYPPKTEREQQVDDDERPQEGDVGDPIIELPLKKPAKKSVAIDEPLEIIKLRPDSFDSIVPRPL